MDPFHASIGSSDRRGVTMTQKEVEAMRIKRGRFCKVWYHGGDKVLSTARIQEHL